MSASIVRFKVMVVFILVLFILAGGVLLLMKRPWDRPPLEIVLAEPRCRVTFCVYGEVESPGIYRLDECGIRLGDAIEAAGGFTRYAASDAVNIHASIHNGDLVHVPSRNDVPQRVNINTADGWLLEALPGIGPALAGRIIDYRRDNGPFGSTDELMMVTGIGEAKYQALRHLVTVD